MSLVFEFYGMLILIQERVFKKSISISNDRLVLLYTSTISNYYHVDNDISVSCSPKISILYKDINLNLVKWLNYSSPPEITSVSQHIYRIVT